MRGTNVFQKENLLYKANEDLLREMEIMQKEKEYQRLMREKQRQIQEGTYRVEELHTDGSKTHIKTEDDLQSSHGT